MVLYAELIHLREKKNSTVYSVALIWSAHKDICDVYRTIAYILNVLNVNVTEGNS